MQRWRGLDNTPPTWGSSVVTIGVFDGVHRGHQHIIGETVAQARQYGLSSLVLTFDPPPLEVLRPSVRIPALTTQDRKAELIADLGVDGLCVAPFTEAFSKLPPEQFASQALVEALHAHTVIVGENFRFGYRAGGDIATLTELGRSLGFTVCPVGLRGPSAVAVTEQGATSLVFSSTAVRASVATGDVRSAMATLGRPHRIDGVVVRGAGRGRQLGFPTANVEPSISVAMPADGIYAGYLTRLSSARTTRWSAAISIGSNPTFGGEKRTLEAYALGFDGSLYGDQVGVEFVEPLRAMMRFDSVDALVAQMTVDVAAVADRLPSPGSRTD